MTIIQVKVISGHQVKKVKPKNFGIYSCDTYFYVRERKNAKNDPITLLKRQSRSKNKIRKITVKSRNDVKSACFLYVLCHISAIFEDINLSFTNFH